MKKVLVAVLLAAVFGAGFLLGRANAPVKVVFQSPTGWVRVARIVDGDTFVIEGRDKERVRLIGVGAPESTKEDNIECFGPEATEKLEKSLLGKKVFLERDDDDRDNNGRLLRYVYSGESREIFVNRELIREGYAWERYVSPNKKYRALFKEAEREARDAKRGLWGACKVEEESKTKNKKNKKPP